VSALCLSAFFALGLGALLARVSRAADESRATTCVRAGLSTFAAIVVVEEALGVGGVLGARATLLALGLAVAGVGAATAGHAPAKPTSREPWTPLEVGLAAALFTGLACRSFDGLHRTTFLYDTLSYHLHAPVTWLHDGRLSIVPAVFGDPAPAYAPSNVELLWLFLMAPLRSDYLAQTGQAPLAALACVAVAATAREAGARRAHALAAALAFLLVPEIWQQTSTAMTDLGMAAFFAAALPFLVRLVRNARDEPVGDAVAFGLAVGLCAGSKVVGLVFTLPLAVVAVTLTARRSTRAALALVLAAVGTGGFWYARNFFVAGNPLYPVTVKLGATTLFPGVHDGAVLRTSEYHVAASDLGALGGLLLEAGVGFAGGAALALARRPRWALLACVLVASFWLVIPYQESRFLFPLWAVAAIALAPRGAGTMGAASARTALWVWTPLALAIGGALVAFPTGERCALVGVAAFAAFVAAKAPARVALRTATIVGAVVGLPGVVVVVAAVTLGLPRYRARDPGYSVEDELTEAWSWMRAHARGVRVAYTGNNLAFPLAGADLANDVRYVNVAGAPTDLLHDFARRTPGAASTDPEPAPYREGARYELWRANLRAARRELLFVARLYPGVARTLAHDDEAFPLERAWADAHPDVFALRFASPAARVYAVAP
jgi:hypothetical protein